LVRRAVGYLAWGAPVKRSHIPYATKLASALLTIVRPDETGKMVPVISYEESKKMTAEQVIARFRFDHYPIPHAQGGPDHHSNLVPRPVAEHDEKTAKIDVPQIAKTKRIAKDVDAHRARMLAKLTGEDPPPTARKPKSKIPSRAFSEQHRPLRSRNTLRRERAIS
jgi:hypothetical protein